VKFSQRAVEEVLKRLGITGLLRGKRFWANCPNGSTHEKGIDRKASWMIRLDGDRVGQHHCFTCKFGGGLAELVKHVRDLQTIEAARAWVIEVAQGAGHDAPRRVRWQNLPLTTPTFRVPAGVVFKPLDQWVTPARRYALSRGLTAEQIEEHGIGYAVEGRCEGRIVIFTRNAAGQPVNYTGRTFVDDDRRYLNATTEEHPDLGVLFGEHLWSPVRERQAIAVTEGALNALAVQRVLTGPGAHDMHGAHGPGVPDLHGTERPGVLDVGALNGSNVQVEHFSKLSTFPIVLVLTDPDQAGDDCALELQGGLGRHCVTVRVRPPDGTDAAKLAESKHGTEQLRGLLWHGMSQGLMLMQSRRGLRI